MSRRSDSVAGTSPRRNETWWPSLAIAALTFAAYLPALRAGFIWDDDAYVTHNAVLSQPGGLWRIWFEPTATIQYYPLVFTTFWLEHALWGIEPFGYHLVNVALHALNAVLLWRILLKLEIPGALLAACLFAVHPVHVESVAWVTERKNVLSLAFALLATLAYLRFAGLTGSDLVEPRRRWGLYAASLILFAAALLSKTATLGVPIALGLVIWWKRPDVLERHMLPLMGFGPLIVVAAAITTDVEKHYVGAGELDWSLPWLQRFLLAGRSICFYLGKLLWPVNQSFIYQRNAIDPQTWSSYACLLGAAFLLAAAWLARRRIGRGPVAALLIFVVLLGPALGFVPFYFMTYSFVADHFQYFASIGPIVLVAAALARATRRRTARATTGAIAGAAPAITLVLTLSLAILTWRRCMVFENQETLWKDVLTKSPSAARQAHDNLAVYSAGLGRLDDAAMHYRASLREKADQPEVLTNLGGVLYQLGRKDEAIDSFREAIRLRPTHADAHCNLALLLAERGAVQEAMEHYQSAIAARPGFATAHFNLARLLAARGMLREAEAEYVEVLRIDAIDAEARRDLEALRSRMRTRTP